MSARTFGPYTVETSNEDKVFFPDDGITKGDLIEYASRIGQTMLPHLKDRPVSMVRAPDGIGEQVFFQKKLPDHFPDWIGSAEVTLADGAKQKQVVVNNTAALVYLADQGCIAPHPWLSRTGALDRPDRMLFDLDPPGDDFAAVIDAARNLRDLLEDLDLPARVQLTGSRGLHVLVPLDGSDDFDAVRSFARDVAKVLAGKYPHALTTEQRKASRSGRIFLDTMRNSYGQTAVAPYSVRARPGAPVAVPLEWDELTGNVGPQDYTIGNIFRRLAAKEDPWKALHRHAHSLAPARDRLAERVRESQED